MASQPGKQTITILILPNISHTKGNKTIKFGQVIESWSYNTKQLMLILVY